jgi:uncharacterized protein YhaN
MRIDEIAVDGFGLLRDRRLEPAPGLTLIRGENEAGKSTLLAFIRAMLFGFDPKSPAALAGGRRGGWLIVRPAGSGPIHVERYGTTGGSGQLRLLDDGGDDLGADSLVRILQGVEKAVYRNIFAFGLSELTEFETLTGPAIADRIYGAGMGTGATSVVEVENALEKLRSEIFVQRGRNPRINVLLAEIDDLESRIEGTNPPEAFREAGERRSALELELATLKAAATASAMERQRLERLRDGWSSWLALESARTKFAELSAEPPAEAGDGQLPSVDLLERLVRTERDLAGLIERRAELAALREQATRERDSVVIDDRLLAARPAAEALLAELGEARGDRARLVDRERDLAERLAAVAEAVRRLGPGWDEARVAGVDDSLEAQGAISGQFRTLLEAADRDLAAARTAAGAAAQNQADARVELAAIATPGSIAPLVATPVLQRAGKPGLELRFASPAWLLIGLLLGLVAAEGTLLLGLGGVPAVIVGLVAGVATALIGPAVRDPGVTTGSRTKPADGSLAARIAERTERLNLLVERHGAAQERLAEAVAANTRATEAWNAWLTGHGLPADLDRETAARILDGVRAVRTGLVGLGTAQDRRAETAARLSDFEDRGAALLAGLGRSADDPIAGLEAVRRDLGAALAAAATKNRGIAELARIDGLVASNETAITAAQADQAAILAEGGAGDAAELRAAVALASRRLDAQRAIDSARDVLLALSGPGEALAAFEADLAAVGDLARIQDDLAVVLARGREVEERRAAVLEGLGAERETIARIERSAESAELRQQRADRIAELRELAESWSITSIALALLRRTRERYEREHRPEVLRAAEELLATWTGGRYVRILAPLGKQVQELERDDGVVVPLGGLSTGTAQQLYLALRFGLVEHFARQAESLPIVMDDILVNFDPVRAERAARSIEDLATRHQVLYFTCHPGTPLRAATTIELPTLVRG